MHVKHYYMRCINDFCSAVKYFSTHFNLSDPDVQNSLAAELSYVVCQTLNAYCMECSTQGIHLDWRRSDLCRKPPHIQFLAWLFIMSRSHVVFEAF